MTGFPDPDACCGEQWLSSNDLDLVDQAVAARDAEIARLERENAALKRGLIDHGLVFADLLHQEQRCHDRTKVKLRHLEVEVRVLRERNGQPAARRSTTYRHIDKGPIL